MLQDEVRFAEDACSAAIVRDCCASGTPIGDWMQGELDTFATLPIAADDESNARAREKLLALLADTARWERRWAEWDVACARFPAYMCHARQVVRRWPFERSDSWPCAWCAQEPL